MLSLSSKIQFYNYSYTSFNSYRFVTIHRNLRCNNTIDLFNISKVIVSYVSPLMNDVNNISVLGAFMVIKLLTTQFPYIAKYKLKSTLLIVHISLLFHLR